MPCSARGRSIMMTFVFAPLMMLAAGMLAGVSWAGLFLPGTFFNSSIGTRWMKLCGTKRLKIHSTVRRHHRAAGNRGFHLLPDLCMAWEGLTGKNELGPISSARTICNSAPSAA